MGGGGGDGKKKKPITAGSNKLQKSYFDVLGLCCSSEVPLIEKILRPLEGVKDVSVIVPSRTVIVVHDSLVISQLQIEKALNQARLEANVRVYGESNYEKKWPSPYAVICGILLSVSFLKFLYHPLQWLALGAVAIGICPILLRGVSALRNFTLDSNILVLIAVVGSIALADYWEAGTIVFLFTIAEWLESRASHKATAMMSSLMNIVPQKAVLAETGEEVDADEVKVNTLLAVKPGEIIPIDGVVTEGKCEVDEKTLTGESFPVPKQRDSIVWAGTINLNGYITVKTSALAEDCVVARMAKLVEDAQNNKSKTQRFIDQCAKYYTPAIVAISACLAAIPAILRLHSQSQWFRLALVVLVSACPCALILSTPVATFAALSKAATSGLLIKGGEYLETLSQIKTIAFDKTGTITRGEFIISDFRSLSDGLCLNTLLFWVSSIESKSSHPMAAALVDYGRSQSVEPKPEEVKEFENFPGEGIHGKIDGQNVYVGNRKMAARAGCPVVPSLEGNKEGKSIGYIFLGDTPAGIFSLSDACRTGAGEAITELKSMGIKTAMLTGDSHQAATLVQNQLGGALDEVHSELLPQDKARIIKDFQKQAPTAMVGDGLNDTLALATADIGISMGISGSALAAETGHVILMSNDIRKIPKIINLARKARRKVIENVILSILTKAAIISLAIAGHPLVWAAVLADVGTCLVVILNSMLLLRREEKNFPKTCFQKYGNGHNNCHSSHSHPHGCSDGEAKATKRPQKCCSRRFAPSCGPEPKPKPLSKTCSEKHGKGHNSCHSSHSHQHGCSDSKAKTTKKPQKCCSRRCAPTCGPDPPSSSPCEKIKSSKCCGHEDQVIQEEKHLDHHECCELVARGIELREGSHKHSCSGSCEEEKCKEMADMHEIFPDSYEKCMRTKMASQDVQGLNLAPKGECYLNIPCKHNHSSDEEEQVNCFTEEASIHNGVNLPSTSKVSLGIDDHHLRCEVAKACSNRQIGGCCKSFREECCTKCGHLGANFGGGLTEIVIDLASK